MLRLIEIGTMGVFNADVQPGKITMGKLLTLFQMTMALAMPVFAHAAAPSAAPAVHPVISPMPVAPVRAMTEVEKIESLITTVEKSQGLQFIRNGSAHDPAAAANHLRLKWKNAGKRVHTAEDFIRYCATGSSMSGKPYQIRFSSGKTVNSADYFHAQLRLLGTPAPKVQAAAVKR